MSLKKPMPDNSYLPEITALTTDHQDAEDISLYKDVIYKILRQTVPQDFFKHEFDSELPIIKSSIKQKSRKI